MAMGSGRLEIRGGVDGGSVVGTDGGGGGYGRDRDECGL